MKKICFLVTFISTAIQAHEPYITPLSHFTDNSQVAIVAGYTEEALNSEHALKDFEITVTDPRQQSSKIKSSTNLKSVSVIDLALPQSGTYLIEAKTSFPLNYVKDQKDWKMLFEVPVDKAGPKSDRDYLIPDDFKNKKYQIEKITREWTLQSYITKHEAYLLTTNGTAPIQVTFQANPTTLKTNEPVQLKILKNNQALKNTDIHIRYKGESDKDAQNIKSDKDGNATITFKRSGEYLIEVTEHIESSQKPKNQFYTIISLSVK